MDCEFCHRRAVYFDVPTRYGVRSLCEECHDEHAVDPEVLRAERDANED